MDCIGEFLTSEFLPRRQGMTRPDGRLLYRYDCSDGEFFGLIDLLTKGGPPRGYDFTRYKERWQELRGVSEGRRRRRNPVADVEAELWESEPYADLERLAWTIRGFVLYASEFWYRFRNDDWKDRHFPDGAPFRKLTWLSFLSVVGWDELYRGKIAGYVALGDTGLQVAHSNDNYSGDCVRKRGIRTASTASGGARTSNDASYPGLYFPMLAAWTWWQVAPLRLPTSIRYLDTLAHQGGSNESLVLHYDFAYETDSKVVYRPTMPPDGHGMDAISLSKLAIPEDADTSEINVEVVFGAPRMWTGQDR